jgi:hypothetical protein
MMKSLGSRPRTNMRGGGGASGLVSLIALLASCGLQEHPRGPVVSSPPTTPPGAPSGTPHADGGSPEQLDARAAPPPDGAPPTPDGPPATVVAGVDINGVRVPREKALVFIHYGHSNMAGHGENPAELRPFFYDTDPRLWSYRGGGRFVPAKEPTAPDSTASGAGPGMAWLRTAAAAAAPGYTFISIARGRGSATTADYLKGGLYYSSFMDRAVELKGKVTFAGVFVMLGITDRHMPLEEQGGFADRSAQIIADLRADLGEPDLPVLHSDYEVTATGTLSLATDYARRIRPLILSLPDRIPNLAIIPCDGITLEDDHHFTLAGHKLWVERGVQIMIDRGWFPWKK